MYQLQTETRTGIQNDTVSIVGTVFTNPNGTIKYDIQTGDTVVLRIINLYDESTVDYLTNNLNPFTVAVDQHFYLTPNTYALRAVILSSNGTVRNSTELLQFVITE